MGLNATELLGAEQVAGVRVNRRGYNLAVLSRQRVGPGGSFAGGAATGAGGMLGAVLLARWARKTAKAEATGLPRSAAPEFGQMAFLAVTDRELALVGINAKTTAKLTTVLARVPRSDVASVTMGGAPPLISKPITVTLANGDEWLLEVSAAMKRNARGVVNVFA
jgi:hypothetical protein